MAEYPRRFSRARFALYEIPIAPAGLVASAVSALILNLVPRREYVARRQKLEVEVEDRLTVGLTLVPPEVPAAPEPAARAVPTAAIT